MPEAIAFDQVALRYPGAASDAVGPVSFGLQEGERVLLLGPSGAGKSTLLHCVTGLIPDAIPGTRRGDIRIRSDRVDSRRPSDWADTVAYLFQDAEQTLAGFTVEDEVAFALENRSAPAETIPYLVEQALMRAGLPLDWAARRISALSGGEKQCVALAALVAQSAPVTLADEPTASLAPQVARRMADLILAEGCTTLIVDHKPGPLLKRIDRCVAIGRTGRIMADGTPEDVFGTQAAELARHDIALPLPARLHLDFPDLVRPGLSVSAALQGLPDTPAMAARLRDATLPRAAQRGAALVTLSGAACAPPFGPVVLRNVTLSLWAGEVLAVVGPNGAGKSTLAACLAGLIPPRAGNRNGPPGAVAFQNPEAHFSRETIRAEIAALPLSSQETSDVLARWGLMSVAAQHPFNLSQGQKRRLALALLTESDRWPVLVLDEPTSGLDGTATDALRLRIRELAVEGRGLAVITHDLDFALAVADRAVLIDCGGVEFDGPCTDLMRNTRRLEASGLLAPEAAPILHRIAAAC